MHRGGFGPEPEFLKAAAADLDRAEAITRDREADQRDAAVAALIGIGRAVLALTAATVLPVLHD